MHLLNKVVLWNPVLKRPKSTLFPGYTLRARPPDNIHAHSARRPADLEVPALEAVRDPREERHLHALELRRLHELHDLLHLAEEEHLLRAAAVPVERADCPRTW